MGYFPKPQSQEINTHIINVSQLVYLIQYPRGELKNISIYVTELFQ